MSEQILRLVEGFRRTVREPSWAGDHDNRLGMSYDFDLGLEIHGGLFREQSQREDGDTLFYEVQWLGEGRALHDLIRDFYMLLSEFAEQSSFVRYTLGNDEVTFSIATGHEGERPHGHFLVIRLVGPAVKEMLKGYRKMVAHNRTLRDMPAPIRK